MPRANDDIPFLTGADTPEARKAFSEAQSAAEKLTDFEITPRYEMVRVVLRWMGLWAAAVSFFFGRLIWLFTPMAWPVWARLLIAGLPGVYMFFYMVRLGRRFDRILILLSKEEKTRRRSDALVRRIAEVEEQLNLAIDDAEARSEEERVRESEKRIEQDRVQELLGLRRMLRGDDEEVSQ